MYMIVYIYIYGSKGSMSIGTEPLNRRSERGRLGPQGISVGSPGDPQVPWGSWGIPGGSLGYPQGSRGIPRDSLGSQGGPRGPGYP